MAASSLLPEDQLLCHICKTIFSSPVTLPCGHNLCQSCITKEWDRKLRYQCPICKEVFNKRPQLRSNRFISEMANRFRESITMEPSGNNCSSIKSNTGKNNGSNRNIRIAGNNTSSSCTITDESNFNSKLNTILSTGNSEINNRSNSSQLQQQIATEGEISCDECTGLKLKAVKSCLVCLTSYCETHLKPHLVTKGLKKHQLLDPVENLEARVCSDHNKPLEFFCRTDQKIICMFCTLLDHRVHDYVSLSEESGQKTSVLRGTEGTLNQMIQERRANMQDLRHTSKLNKEAADSKAAAGLQVFIDLKQILEKGLNELIKNIEMRQTTVEQLTTSLIAELGQEVKVLMQSSADVQQLSLSDDRLHVLQSFSSVNNIPAMKDWSEVGVQLPLYEEMVRKAVVEAVDQLQTTFRKANNKLLEAELKRMQTFKVNLTLDPQTADPWLIVSNDCKQVCLGDIKKTHLDESKRFNPGGGVVAKQSFCSGRFYFEVQVMGMMKYDLGVVHASISRKKKITKSQKGGHWILSLRNGSEYKARASHDVPLSLTCSPQRIGLFVDYEEGLVSFYDVEIVNLIFSFNDCSFTDRLYPFFNPGQGSKSSVSLIVSPL